MVYFAWTEPVQGGGGGGTLNDARVTFAIAQGNSLKVYSLRQSQQRGSNVNNGFIVTQEKSFYSAKEMLCVEFLNENLLGYLDGNNVLTILAVH